MLFYTNSFPHLSPHVLWPGWVGASRRPQHLERHPDGLRLWGRLGLGKIAFMPSPLKIDFRCMVLLGHCISDSGNKQLQTVFHPQVVGTL